jgi:tetratricopeptide (TPR) repeat protein
MAAVLWLVFIALIEILLLDLIFSIKNCDLLTGLGFYLAIPVVSCFFTAGLASACALGSRTRRQAGWLYAFVVFLFLSRVVIRLARGHTIGMHDPFIGELSLPIYESEANLDSGFLYSRLLLLVATKLFIVGSILLADRRLQSYHPRNLIPNLRRTDTFLPEIETGAIALVLFVLGLYYQGPLGIEITRKYLEHALDGKAVTEHFIIRYPTGGEVEEDLERIAEDHEYYYRSIVDEIGVAPEGPIRAYIYPDRTEKSFLTGVGSGVYAKPWTGEIHVEYNRLRIDALKHELVHVISAPMGVPFFGSSLLGAYGEGIAEGIQWDTANDLTYHQWAAALRVAVDPVSEGPFFPRDIAPLRLLTRNFREGGFYVGRIPMNYYLAASHTRWMLDTYGRDAYSAAYIKDDTLPAVGMTQAQEAEAWMQYLDNVPLTEDEIAFAAMAFSPPKFAVRVCAHERAEHERLAGEHIARSAWQDAYDEYTVLLEFSPGNIIYGYHQARMLYNMERYEEALELVRAIREWPGCDAGWQAYLNLLQGDVQGRDEQLSEAASAYARARDEAINDSVKETATLRLDILASPARDEFLAAFREPEDARWRYERARSLDEGWLPDYYLGAELVADREYEAAQEYLLECLRLDPPHPFVRRTCLHYLGICAYRLERYSLARQDFQDAGLIAADIFLAKHPAYNGVIPLDRLDSWSSVIADWLLRCEWRETWSGIPHSSD